jgi:hypothetical protein
MATAIIDGRGGAAARVARSAIERGGEGIAIDATRGSSVRRGRGRGAALVAAHHQHRHQHRPPPLQMRPRSRRAPRHRACTSRRRGCAPCRGRSRTGRAPSTSA